MKRWLSIALQGIAFVGHGVVPQLTLEPGTMQMVHAVLGGVQGVLAIIAHNYNPDGTTVKVAYFPKKKDGGRPGSILG